MRIYYIRFDSEVVFIYIPQVAAYFLNRLKRMGQKNSNPLQYLAGAVQEVDYYYGDDPCICSRFVERVRKCRL